MKNVQCPFRRFRSSSLMRGNQCGKERNEARRILHSRGGSSFVQRTQILSIFFRGLFLFILSFIFVFTAAFLN